MSTLQEVNKGESLISQQVKNLSPSGIRKFFDLLASMEGVISLGVGEPDYATPWHISEAAVRFLQDEPQPLVVVLPPGWSPDDPDALLPPLDTTWVDLDTVADICGAPKDLIEQLAKDFGRRFWDPDFVGKPREACLDDLLSGKAKFHNVFHYPTETWADIGVIAWLVATVLYASFWLAFALLLSVVIRGAASAALIGFGGWLGLTRATEWMFMLAGGAAFIFGLAELKLLKIRMPAYGGRTPKFIEEQGDYLKAFFLGLFLGKGLLKSKRQLKT